MSSLRRDKRLKGVNNGIRALIPGLRLGEREVQLDDYVEEALLFSQQAGEWFSSASRQRNALTSAVQILISGGILGWNVDTRKVYVPEETEALFQQVPDRDAGDSSMQAYTAHAGILRRLFSLPLKTKTKHQLQWDNIELKSSNVGLRRERDSSQQERDTMHHQYETVRAERDTLRGRCSELEKECESLLDKFDAQEVEARELQPEAEEAEEASHDEQQVGRHDLQPGTAVRLERITLIHVPSRASTPAGPSNHLPATPPTPTRRPSYGQGTTLSSSHSKMRKAQSMPCRTTLEGYSRGQNRFSPLTPVSNARPLAGINLEAHREEPPSPTEEHMQRAAPLDHPVPELTGFLPVNEVPVAMEGEARDPSAMDEDEDVDESAPQSEPEPEPQPTSSLYDIGRNALYQIASVVTSPSRLFRGRGTELSMQQAQESAPVDAAPDSDPMAVDYEPTEDGSIFNLREHSRSAGRTPPATPPHRHDPFSFRGTQRDRWQERVGELEAEVKDLEDELRRALQLGDERNALARELERKLREKEAALKALVDKLRPVMPAFVEAASHVPGASDEFAAYALGRG